MGLELPARLLFLGYSAGQAHVLARSSAGLPVAFYFWSPDIWLTQNPEFKRVTLPTPQYDLLQVSGLMGQSVGGGRAGVNGASLLPLIRFSMPRRGAEVLVKEGLGGSNEELTQARVRNYLTIASQTEIGGQVDLDNSNLKCDTPGMQVLL